MQATLNSYFDNVVRTIEKIPLRTIDQIGGALMQTYESSHMIYLFGNGGSAALASHSACDLEKGRQMVSGRRFQGTGVHQYVPHMTAWANDARYEDIFPEQFQNFVRPNDITFAISGSGKSPNVLKALKVGC